MWLTIEISIAAGTFLLLCQTARRLGSDWLSIFLLVALWLRFVMAAFDEYTFPAIVGGQSLIAISSLLVATLGCLLVPLPLLTNRNLVPVYGLIGWTLFSGAMNGQFSGAASDLMKWLYHVALCALSFRMFSRYGLESGLRLMLVPLSTPVLLQIASLITNTPNLGADGHYNYIGGYFHEAVFSLVIMTSTWIAATITWTKRWVGHLLVFASFIGIVAANYRTMIVAALPILVVYFWRAGRSSGEQQWRRLALLIAMPLGALAATTSPEVQSRFDDLFYALGNASDLVKPASEYTEVQRRLLSTRIYLWAQYFGAFADADITRTIIGFGPQAHAGSFFTHPHNMFIYVLYNTGIGGMLLLSVVIARNLLMALRIADGRRRWLVLAGHLAFLLANLATSPLSEIEGLILYAMLCAATWHLAEARVRQVGRGRRHFAGPSRMIRSSPPGRFGKWATPSS